MQNVKPRLLLTVALVIGVLVVSAPNAWGQVHCMAFRGAVTRAYFNGSAWVGEGWFTIGQGQPRPAEVVDVNTGMKRQEGNVWIGTETATWTFQDVPGDSFVLITKFTAPLMTNPSGVFRVNETGTIAPGSGIFSNVYGQFTLHGPFGPGVPGPGGWNWTGEYHGTICGVK